MLIPSRPGCGACHLGRKSHAIPEVDTFYVKDQARFNPRHPVIFSDDDWGVQSPPQHSLEVPLPFSGGDWISRAIGL